MKAHLALGLAVALAVKASGQTVYVNGACGDDAWSGLSQICAAPNGPKRTIQAAIPASGNVNISVAPGTYAESVSIIRHPDEPVWAVSIESQGGPAVTTIDGLGTASAFLADVGLAGGSYNDVSLRGFTIRNAVTGIQNSNRIDLQVRDCVLTDCVIGLGGEVHALADVSACVFHDNSSYGIAMPGGLAEVDRCVFTNNGRSAVFATDWGYVFLYNSLIAFNGTAASAAVFLEERGWLTLTNVTVAANAGPGIRFIPFGAKSALAVDNSIVWGNNGGGTQISVEGPPFPFDIRYTIVQGLSGGIGVLDADPLFVNASGGDFRLSAGSPAIDSCDADFLLPERDTDLDGQPRFQDDPAFANTGVGALRYLDRGPYEAAGRVPCEGDVDGDFDVDLADLARVLSDFGRVGPRPTDLNGDGFVDLEDLALLLANFGVACG